MRIQNEWTRLGLTQKYTQAWQRLLAYGWCGTRLTARTSSQFVSLLLFLYVTIIAYALNSKRPCIRASYGLFSFSNWIPSCDLKRLSKPWTVRLFVLLDWRLTSPFQIFGQAAWSKRKYTERSDTPATLICTDLGASNSTTSCTYKPSSNHNYDNNHNNYNNRTSTPCRVCFPTMCTYTPAITISAAHTWGTKSKVLDLFLDLTHWHLSLRVQQKLQEIRKQKEEAEKQVLTPSPPMDNETKN